MRKFYFFSHEKILNNTEKLLPHFKEIIIGENKDSDFDEVNPLSRVLVFILIMALVLMCIVFFIDILFGFFVDLGKFGDFFGGMLNPIFTFLTFFGVVITIVMQRVELRLTREEYSKTNQEIKTQTLENQFFNLIDLHNKICESLVFKYLSKS